MRRVTKKLLVFLLGVLFTGLYCEFLIYYVVISQCSWPGIKTTSHLIEESSHHDVLKVLILADPHLLGPRKGHWLDKWRREYQMHRSFQTIMTLHKPEAVFVLGDLFDEGEWSSKKQFEEYVRRFYRLFAVPEHVTMHVAVGNHDVGYHYHMARGSMERFSKATNSSSVQFITLKNNHFVLINSMAMEGDKCNMCTEARTKINFISEKMSCSRAPGQCDSSRDVVNYSRPILMQHFPLFRKSDIRCTEPDAKPLPGRKKVFMQQIDVLSKEATEYLVSKIRPRAAFGGHTHHGCLVHHIEKDYHFYEYSVPSFSWRNRPDPKYMLVSITPRSYAVQKCGLPLETTIALSAMILLFIVAWQASTKVIGR